MEQQMGPSSALRSRSQGGASADGWRQDGARRSRQLHAMSLQHPRCGGETRELLTRLLAAAPSPRPNMKVRREIFTHFKGVNKHLLLHPTARLLVGTNQKFSGTTGRERRRRRAARVWGRSVWGFYTQARRPGCTSVLAVHTHRAHAPCSRPTHVTNPLRTNGRGSF